MEEEDDYSVPNCKINEIDRSRVNLINLLGVGQVRSCSFSFRLI